MNGSKIEISREQVWRHLWISVMTVMIAAACFMYVTKHSKIRNVDIIVIPGLGANIGVLIGNLVLVLKLRKQRDSTEQAI